MRSPPLLSSSPPLWPISMPYSFLLSSPTWKLLVEPPRPQNHQATQFQGHHSQCALSSMEHFPSAGANPISHKGPPWVSALLGSPKNDHTLIWPSHLWTCQSLSFVPSHLDIICLEQSPNYFGSPSSGSPTAETTVRGLLRPSQCSPLINICYTALIWGAQSERQIW